MLLALQQNLLLDTYAPPSLAFSGPDIDDWTIPQQIAASADYTARFTGASGYTLIGDLPPGMSFSAGVISGTPTTPGRYGPFIIRAN